MCQCKHMDRYGCLHQCGEMDSNIYETLKKYISVNIITLVI